MEWASTTATVRGRLWPVLMLAFAAVAPASALAQTNSLFSATPSTGLISPLPATRGDIFGPSNLPIAPPAQPLAQAPGPSTASIPMVPAGQVALALSARFGKDAPAIPGGLT